MGETPALRATSWMVVPRRLRRLVLRAGARPEAMFRILVRPATRAVAIHSTGVPVALARFIAYSEGAFSAGAYSAGREVCSDHRAQPLQPCFVRRLAT